MTTFVTEREDFLTRSGAAPHFRAYVRMAAMTASAAFQARGWTWKRTDPRSPSVTEIEDTLWGLIASVKKNGQGSSSTGRLYAEVGEDGDVHLSMDLGTLDGFLDGGESS